MNTLLEILSKRALPDVLEEVISKIALLALLTCSRLLSLTAIMPLNYRLWNFLTHAWRQISFYKQLTFLVLSFLDCFMTFNDQ